MWRPEHRRAADRTDLRYSSDLGKWLVVEPMIPPAKRGARRRSANVGEVLNGIFYILWDRLPVWKALPKDLPRKSTVRSRFDAVAGPAGCLDGFEDTE
jgi:transposase